MIGPALAVVAFVAMEVVSYLAHRFVMHGPGMVWHRSHHVPATGRFERNDLFPACFSVVGVGIFACAAIIPAPALYWVGGGVTAYGLVYLFVHELYIHRRLPVPLPRVAYLEWLRASHRIHHRFGGEPYGMLLPLVSRSLRSRAASAPGGDPLARSPSGAAGGAGAGTARAARRRSTRSARMRL